MGDTGVMRPFDRFRSPHGLVEQTLGAGAAFTGRLWCGDGTENDRGRVVVDTNGVVSGCVAATDVDVPFGAFEIEGPWIRPGLVDHHVLLAFGSPPFVLARGVVVVRDLG